MRRPPKPFLNFRRAAIAAACLCALAVSARGADPLAGLVEAELVADVRAVRPAKSFSLGVLLTIRDEWHIYWRFPGDAGLATEVAFRLPTGFKAGELQWPLPATFRQPGDFVGYGYAHSVLLWTTVTAPPALAAGSKVTLRAEVSWLACKDRCVPGEAKLRLTLPVAHTAAAPAHEKLFATWRKRLPIAAGAETGAPRARVHGGFARGARQARVELRLHWEREPGRVEWLPAPTNAITLDGVVVRTKGRETSVAFTATLVEKDHEKELSSLVVTTDAKGSRQGYELTVRLHRDAATIPMTTDPMKEANDGR